MFLSKIGDFQKFSFPLLPINLIKFRCEPTGRTNAIRVKLYARPCVGLDAFFAVSNFLLGASNSLDNIPYSTISAYSLSLKNAFLLLPSSISPKETASFCMAIFFDDVQQ